MGSVKPKTDRYFELVRINGSLYHNNTNAWLVSLFNESFDTNYVPKKQFSIEEETLNDGIRDAVTGLVIGKAFKVLGGVTGVLLKKAGGSIWNLPYYGMGSRGFVYEKMLGLKGLMKAHNFPKIDAFYKGIATSVKTLDIYAKKYLNDVSSSAVKKQLTKYVDDLNNFKGASWGDDVVRGVDIKQKVLEVGIPRGASKGVINQIDEVIKYAEDLNIKMNVRVVD